MYLYLFTASHSGLENAASLGFLLSSSLSGGRDGARPCKTRLGPSSFLFPRGCAGDESADPGIWGSGRGGWGGVRKGAGRPPELSFRLPPLTGLQLLPFLGQCRVRQWLPDLLEERFLLLGGSGCVEGVFSQSFMGVGTHAPTHWALNGHLLRAACALRMSGIDSPSLLWEFRIFFEGRGISSHSTACGFGGDDQIRNRLF